MIRIENRFQLKQVRAECQAETKQEKCRAARAVWPAAPPSSMST